MRYLEQWEANKAQAALFFGVTQRTFDDWVNKGLQIQKKGKSWAIYLPDVFQWLKAGKMDPKEKLDLTAERARLAMQQADRVELENMLTRGEVVKIADIIREFSSVMIAFRQKMLAIPNKAAPHLVGCETVAEMIQELETFINEPLQELEQLKSIQERAAKGDFSSKAATEVDDKPVVRPVSKAKSGGKRRAGTVAH